MSWGDIKVAPEGTHHLTGDAPLYAERFDEVLAFHPPGLAPVRLNGQAWHIRPDGSEAYERRFKHTFGFYEGLGAVVAEDGWYHIRPDGLEVSSARYDWCGNYQDGRCSVRDEDGAYYHLTASGEPAYAQRWRYAGDFRNGIAVVQGGDGRSTHIGKDGRPVHGRWFLDLDVFHKGFARARDEDGWMHVDGAGRPAYLRRFAAVEPFYNGQARVETFEGGLEVIDVLGTPIVQLRPPRTSEFSALSADLVGFWRTQTLGTAVRLGVFEALPGSETEVANRCGLATARLRRILRALGELRVVREEAGRWTATSRGELLRADHPMSLADAALEYAGPQSALWRHLPEAFSSDPGWAAPDIFAQVAQDEARLPGHHRMLRSYARHDYQEVARALGLRGNEHVVDAGGGLGVLGHMVQDAYPSTHVTVLDLPEVIGLADTAASQVQWLAADLFEPWGIQADAVLLSRVLHDWDDEDAHRILARARETLPPGGRIYVVEMLLSEDAVAGALCDLHLLMVTGGKERSAEAYRRLLASAGFQLEAVRRLPSLPGVLVGVAS